MSRGAGAAARRRLCRRRQPFELAVIAELLEAEAHPAFHGAERQAKAPRDLLVGAVLQVGERYDLALFGGQGAEGLAHPLAPIALPYLCEGLAGLGRGRGLLEAVLLPAEAGERSWSMPRLRTMERTQFRTLPRPGL